MLGKLSLIFVIAAALLLPVQAFAAPWHGGSHRAWHSHQSQTRHLHRRNIVISVTTLIGEVLGVQRFGQALARDDRARWG